MKYESNTPMFSKDIARKPFFVRMGRMTYVRMYVRTYGRTDKGDAICPPPHYKWRGHKNQTFCDNCTLRFSSTLT